MSDAQQGSDAWVRAVWDAGAVVCMQLRRALGFFSEHLLATRICERVCASIRCRTGP